MPDQPPLRAPSTGREVAEFIRRSQQLVAADGAGRLLFALDATASRQATWDRACQLQGEMFQQAAGLGGLKIQLLWYRGFAEFCASPWASSANALQQLMAGVSCAGGSTQIARVLDYALRSSRQRRINGLVFVVDCMEEDARRLAELSGQLGLLKLPVFMFQEGHDRAASTSFRQVATLSGGAHCAFDSASAAQLRDLLRAAAAYASGGKTALAALAQRSNTSAVKQLCDQLGRG